MHTAERVVCRRLEGRVAVVTGSSTGNGRAIALELAREGAQVVCADLRRSTDPNALDDNPEADTDELIVARGGEALFQLADVGDADQMAALGAAAVSRFGRVDIWVNNAGVARKGLIGEVEIEEFEWIHRVNVIGTWLGCRVAAGIMRDQEMAGRARGRIVNLGSIAAQIGQTALPAGAYSSSKGAVHALTRALAVELAPDSISVNALVPGYVLATAMNRAVRENKEGLDVARAGHPWPEMGTPVDLARAAAFLCSDDSAWITGVLLPVDGGFLASA